MPKLKIVLVLTAFLLILSRTFAQQPGNRVLLKGKVIDKKHHTTLPGVTIKVGADATSTDKNGDFTLNTTLSALAEKDIKVSCIGYLSARLIYDPNHFYEVELAENDTQLKEVVISAGDDIIRKAIKRIPENYPQKAIIIKGILRTQAWRNKSQYFKSDALIKAYVPPYDGGEHTSVMVLQNRMDTVYDKTIKYLRHVSNYRIVDFHDVAHNRFILNQILKKKKFDYLLTGKQVFDGHKVYVINSILKDTAKTFDKIDATFYIDTASYAFVAARISIHNWKRTGFLTLKTDFFQTTYQQIGKKWYLAETHSNYAAIQAKDTPESTVDFIRTEIDSVNVERLAYKDIVQGMDDIFLINKPNGPENWSKADTLFKHAETEGKIAIIRTTLLDTIKHNNAVTNPPGVALKAPFIAKASRYLNGDNSRIIVGFPKFPVSFNSTMDAFGGSAGYGWGVGYNFRVYKGFFLDVENYTNYGSNKHVSLKSSTFNLSYEFVFNKNAHSITFAPYLGYQDIEVKYQKIEQDYYACKFGLTTSFEINHHRSFFISGGYNTAQGNRSIYELGIHPTNYEISIGFLLKH